MYCSYNKSFNIFFMIVTGNFKQNNHLKKLYGNVYLDK